MKKKTGPVAQTLESVEAAKALVEKNEVVTIGFFSSADSADAKTFLDVAANVDDMPFGITYNEDIRKEYKTNEKDSAIVLFKKFDEGRADFEGIYRSFFYRKSLSKVLKIKFDISKCDKEITRNFIV